MHCKITQLLLNRCFLGFSRGIFNLILQCFPLTLYIVAYRLAGLLPKRLGNLHLGIDLLLHFVGVENFRYAGFSVAGSHRRVPGDAGNPRLRSAAGVAAVLAHASAAAARSQLAVQADTGANVGTDALGAIVRLILDIGDGERAVGLEAIQSLIYCRLGAGDNRALKTGITGHFDLKSFIPCLDPRLFYHTGVAAVDLALAGADAARWAGAEGYGAAQTFLFGFVVAGVLQAFNVQVAADICNNLLAACHRALERGVAAGLQGQDVARFDVGVAVSHIRAIGIASALTGSQGNAGLAAEAHSYRAAA